MTSNPAGSVAGVARLRVAWRWGGFPWSWTGKAERRLRALLSMADLCVKALVLQWRGNVHIDPRVMKRSILNVVHRCTSVHATALAIAENAELAKAFSQDEHGKRVFHLPGYARVHLPDYKNAPEVVVNDAREIFIEQVYDHQDVSLRSLDIVIDCGANIGLFSTYAIRKLSQLHGGQLICLEPVPHLASVLRRNIQEALRASPHNVNVTVIEKAVAERDRRTTLFVNEECFTMSSLTHHGVRVRDQPALEIQCTSIDAMVKDLHLPRVDFIKMDVEGSEMDALRGAAAVLATFKPRLAVSAYHLPQDFYAIPKLISELNAGYEIVVTRELGPMCYAW